MAKEKSSQWSGWVIPPSDRKMPDEERRRRARMDSEDVSKYLFPKKNSK